MKWLILIGSLILSLFFLFWSFQEAWLSATPNNEVELFKIKAIIFFVISIVILIGGIFKFYKMHRKV